MSEEKTLDEALDEMDKWGEQLSEDIKSLSPQEVVEYFKQSKSRFEEKIGERLNLPVRPAPRGTKA
jgi:hypothetical protein